MSTRPTRQYECPLCGSLLTKNHYHKVIKLKEKKEKVQKGEVDQLKKMIVAEKAKAAMAKKKERESRAKNKRNVELAKKQGILMERKKSENRNKRLNARIKKLEEERKMLRQHTSPQELGLADELILVRRLQREFPNDRIVHVGKGGDVLHYIRFDAADVGCIVYECKREDRISYDHIAQTALAKKTRQANYGILVTIGTRKGFSGLDQDSGILIVAQAGVLTLARICRDSLITMAKQRLDVAEKAAAAKRLMDYVMSPVCKTPLEEAIARTEHAKKIVGKEVKQHIGDWNERLELYQTIHYDISHVQNNIDRVLNGDDPLKLEKLRFEPLVLLMKSERTI